MFDMLFTFSQKPKLFFIFKRVLKEELILIRDGYIKIQISKDRSFQRL
jgi:hypothetical protein